MSAHPHFKNGRIISADGYVKIRLQQDSPFISMANTDSYVPEHRLVMAESLNRCLTNEEIVHHVNGLRKDNRRKNLVTVSRHNHPKHTLQILLQKRIRELENELLKIKSQRSLPDFRK